jgi:hypothetical protein
VPDEDEDVKRVLGSAEGEDVKRALGSVEDEDRVFVSKLFPYSRFLAMMVALLMRFLSVSVPIKVGINAP